MFIDIIINYLSSFGIPFSYDNDIVVWENSENKIIPTEEEIRTKIAELQAEYEANEYQRQRAAEYPSWQDQLDKIYHEGIDVWKAEIKTIKDKYPKG